MHDKYFILGPNEQPDDVVDITGESYKGYTRQVSCDVTSVCVQEQRQLGFKLGEREAKLRLHALLDELDKSADRSKNRHARAERAALIELIRDELPLPDVD